MKNKPLFRDEKPWHARTGVWLATVVVAALVGAGSSMLMETYGRHALNLAAAALFPEDSAPQPFQAPNPAPAPVPELPITTAQLPPPPAYPPVQPTIINPTAAPDIEGTKIPPSMSETQSDPPIVRSDGMQKAIACLTKPTQALLARVEAKFGQVQVVSTCRPGAVVAGTDRPSLHRYGRAIDFLAPAGKKAEVVAWLVKNHKDGGTMTYSGSRHIHIDIGRHFASIAGERQVASAAHVKRPRRLGRDDDWWDL